MTEVIELYLKRAGQLIKEKDTNGVEFRDLIEAIKRESAVLTLAQRNLVLERFFDLWDQERMN